MDHPENHQGQPQGVAPTGLSLPDMVHRFKTMTTKRYKALMIAGDNFAGAKEARKVVKKIRR